MALRFDTIKGEFVDDSIKKEDSAINQDIPTGKRTRFIEIPEPNTVLNGKGKPEDSLGNDGDFYIDTESMQLYGPKDDSWGEPINIIGPAGKDGNPGLNGESIKGDMGDKGDAGICITNITLLNDKLSISLSDGTVKNFIIPLPPKGEDGKEGKGIASITQPSKGKALITYTDNTQQVIELPAGEDGKEIELRRHQMMVQWRYIGEGWKDLFPIPPITSGSGGAGIYEIIRLTDVRINNLQNGQVLAWSVTANKWVNTTISGGSGTENFATMASSTVLTSANTNTVYDNVGASALVVATLPAATQGLKFTFLVIDPDGFQIKAVGTDTIRIASSASSAAGTATSNKPGNAIVLYGHSVGWVAASASGTWALA